MSRRRKSQSVNSGPVKSATFVANTSTLDIETPKAAIPANPTLLSTSPTQDLLSQAKENRERRQFWIDTVVKIVQSIALIGSGVWAVLQFAQQQDKDLHQREKDLDERIIAERHEREGRSRSLRLKFYEEQWPIYLKVCRTIGKIAGAKKILDVSEDIALFREMYHGEMCLVESQQVITAMYNFLIELDKEPPQNSPTNELKNCAILLARACRDSLRLNELFGVEMPNDLKPLLIGQIQNP
jgi:hypothetical protein